MIAQPEFSIKEQNLCGVTSLYRTHPHRTYVVEIELSSEVNGEILQEAVDDTLARMPYFGQALVEREGSFFYAANPLPFEVAEGPLRAVGGPETNWHCVDVTYRDATISFAMFHALCDGIGMNFFIEATVYHYMCRKDGVAYPGEGIRSKGSPVLSGEELDPYTFRHVVDEGFKLDFFAEKHYHLPEVDEAPTAEMRGVSFRVDEAEFMEFVRGCKSSPAAMLALLMRDAVYDVHPQDDETIGALVPVSTRKAFDIPNTYKNCVSALRLPFRAKEQRGLSFAERGELARAKLREGLDPNAMRSMANTVAGAIRQVDAAMHTYAEKAQVLNFSKQANNDSFMVDYVGGLRSEGYADQIMHVGYRATNLDDNYRTVTLYLTATAGHFDIELVRAFESDAYVGAFAEQLRGHGIAFAQGAEERYITPENGLITSLGLA